jgi:acyl carrier protein
MATTAERVKKLIVEQFGVDEPADDATFAVDLGVDSLDVVELIMAAEAEFEIDIRDEDVDALVTVRDAIAYVDGRLKGGK